jgi:hypothetical protein
MIDFYVYCLRRPDKIDPLEPDLTCPFYIGKGSNGRINEHRREAIKLLHNNGKKSIKIKIIHKLWRHDLDFSIDILFNGLSEQEAFKYECDLINRYGRINNGTGILANLTDGGEGPSGIVCSNATRQNRSERRLGKIWDEEIRRKISRNRKGKCLGVNNPFYARKHTEETKQRMSEMKKGKTISEETRKKMIEAQKLRWANTSEEDRLKHIEKVRSRRHSEETKQRMREICKGNKRAKGYTHTEEAKKRIGEASKKRKRLKIKGEEPCVFQL